MQSGCWHAPEQVVEEIQELRVINLIDVVVVPETGPADPFPSAVVAKPADASPIRRGFSVTAQQGDAVAFDDTARAIRSRLVRDIKEQERHVPKVIAHPDFVLSFEITQLSRGGCAASPALDVKRCVGVENGLADQQPEDRTSMVAAKWIAGAAVLAEPLPERRA